MLLRRLLTATALLAALLAPLTVVVGPATRAGALAPLTKVATFDTPVFRGYYSLPTTGEIFSSAAVGDVDGDGQPDIVAGFPDGFVYAWHTNGVRFLAYDTTGSGAVESSPTLVDLNGDGVKDIVVGNTKGYVKGFTGNGTTLFSTRDLCSPICGIFGTPVVADIDRDGHLDIVVGSWDHRVHVWHVDKPGEVSGFPIFTHDTVWSSPAVADLDGDGWQEIVIGGDSDGVPGQPFPRGGIMQVFRHDGTNQPGFPKFYPRQVLWSSPAIVDLDLDGALDIVIGTGTNMPNSEGGNPGWQVLAYNRTGGFLPGWPVNVGGRVMASPAIGDVDGDGKVDVVTLAEDGRVYAHNRFGQLLPGWPQCAARVRTACPVALHASVSLADVFNDGRQHVVVGGEQRMRIFSGDGTLEADADTASGTFPMTAQPTVASIAGQTWIVQTSGFNPSGSTSGAIGRMWIWTTGTALGPSAWPTFHQNMGRTGTVVDDVAPAVTLTVPSTNPTSTRAPVSWSATDAGSGVATFDVAVSDNGATATMWVEGASPSARSGATASGGSGLYGIPGHTYYVSGRATDRAANTSAWSPAGSVTFPGGATNAAPFTRGYAVNAYGAVSSVSSPPGAGAIWPGWKIARGIVARPVGGGGYVLDGWGGVHPFGAAPAISATGYWPGWDIARGIALNPDGASGYVLDGWGGLHPVGGAAPVSSTYWQGWDIARAVVLLPSSTSADPRGYTLDGWGGIHPFGRAPAIANPSYWSGWDIARSITINSDGHSGYLLDGWGGVHPIGDAAAATGSTYWSGWDIARTVVSVGTAASPRGWVLDGFGGVHPFGSAPAVETAQYWGVDVARGLSIIA